MLVTVLACICTALVTGLAVYFLCQRAKDREFRTVIDHLQEDHRKTLDLQIAAVKAEMAAEKAALAAENARIQKEREESLKKEAAETFKTITGTLGEDIRRMKESFDAQKKEAAENSASIKTKFEETAKSLILQTDAVGKGAEDLAKALRGQNKMQGCWGETILENIFSAEGLLEGRDYDREVVIENRLRPDFILHYPDNTDVIVDSKVSLGALSDYYAAQDEFSREDAARRNLRSVLDHIKELTTKEYQKHAGAGRKTLDYVVMFIPNYGAWQLAKSLSPNLFADAFKQNVLITTEETIMPFLRIIRTAWINQEQVTNLKNIVDNAAIMLDRVAEYCSYHEEVQKKLKEAMAAHEKAGTKLADSGMSIVRSAREIERLGVQHKKALPQE